MSKSSLVKKIEALKMAANMGCSGAHKDDAGNWMPCSSHEEMQKISNQAEGRDWRSAVPGYKSDKRRRKGSKRKRRNDGWEELEESGVISIDSLPGGGIVSGKELKKVNPCWPGYVMEGMKKGKKGKLVPNCVPVESKALRGPEFVRDNDVDVFTDIDSAKSRARQLGCIGVSRRMSKGGRVVWTPCSNNSDYSKLAGTTSMGRRAGREKFGRAVRTIIAEELNKPKRKISIYSELNESK